MAPSDRLFTPRFFVMCGFSFTVFLSVFQLLPTAPFHILDLGGTTFASGMFLGFLTYSSAFSAPLTGAFADRVGQRRVLIGSSLAITVFSVLYGLITDYRWMLVLVVVHGVFWSGLLSASAAYMTNMLPERRRAEGIGYWGLATVAALAVAPSLGFWIYRHGWWWVCGVSAALNIAMALIAMQLPASAAARPAAHEPRLRQVAGGRLRVVADPGAADRVVVEDAAIAERLASERGVGAGRQEAAGLVAEHLRGEGDRKRARRQHDVEHVVEVQVQCIRCIQQTTDTLRELFDRLGR